MQHRVLAFCTVVLFIAHPALSHAQAPVVLSAPEAASVLELPLAASLMQNLTRHTTVRLATPAQHAQSGVDYPRWLSDASFHIKNRHLQRQSIVIAAKRGNPTLSTELLLEFDTDGQKTLVPYTFLLDSVSTFAGSPPSKSATTIQPTHAPDLRPPLNTPIIRFTPEEPSVATQSLRGDTDTSVKRPPLVAPSRPLLRSDNKRKINSLSVTAPPTSPPTPPPVVTSSTPVSSPALAQAASSASAPSGSAITALIAAEHPPARLNPPLSSPSGTASLNDWLPTDWLTWATYAGGALLVILLALRLLKSRREKTTNSAPIRKREKKFQESERGAHPNTIFSLSEKQAEEIHQKWLKEQLLAKKAKFEESQANKNI